MGTRGPEVTKVRGDAASAKPGPSRHEELPRAHPPGETKTPTIPQTALEKIRRAADQSQGVPPESLWEAYPGLLPHFPVLEGVSFPASLDNFDSHGLCQDIDEYELDSNSSGWLSAPFDLRNPATVKGGAPASADTMGSVSELSHPGVLDLEQRTRPEKRRSVTIRLDKNNVLEYDVPSQERPQVDAFDLKTSVGDTPASGSFSEGSKGVREKMELQRTGDGPVGNSLGLRRMSSALRHSIEDEILAEIAQRPAETTEAFDGRNATSVKPGGKHILRAESGLQIPTIDETEEYRSGPHFNTLLFMDAESAMPRAGSDEDDAEPESQAVGIKRASAVLRTKGQRANSAVDPPKRKSLQAGETEDARWVNEQDLASGAGNQRPVDQPVRRPQRQRTVTFDVNSHVATSSGLQPVEEHYIQSFNDASGPRNGPHVASRQDCEPDEKARNGFFSAGSRLPSSRLPGSKTAWSTEEYTRAVRDIDGGVMNDVSALSSKAIPSKKSPTASHT